MVMPRIEAQHSIKIISTHIRAFNSNRIENPKCDHIHLGVIELLVQFGIIMEEIHGEDKVCTIENCKKMDLSIVTP